MKLYYSKEITLRKLRNGLCLFLLILNTHLAVAQQDTVVLSADVLMALVIANHPMAKQAQLAQDMGEQELRMARGQFDPKFIGNGDAKFFKEKEYYQLWNAYLKVPTWWGIEFKAGHERNTGINLGQEHDTDGGKGLYYAGISMPLGPLAQGFLLDERRATLRQAQAYQLMAVAERRKMLNKLLFQVAKDYWQWYFAYNQYAILQKGYTLAQFRFEAVTVEVSQGFMASIDSTEAKITLQQREIDLLEAKQYLLNARLILSNHLWTAEGEPAELPETSTPALPQALAGPATLAELKQLATEAHPELLKLRYKNQQLDISRRLAVEGLKPTINGKYNWLIRKPLGGDAFQTSLLNENYKFGLEASVPIIFRKERAKLQLTKMKLQDNQWEQQFEQKRILQEIESAYQGMLALEEMLAKQEAMTLNYVRLLEGERQKFENGQSSVFYMNVREGKLLEAEVKLIKMRSEYRKAYAQLIWTAGGVGL